MGVPTVFKELSAQLRKYDPNKAVIDAAREFEAEIVDMNTSQLYDDGLYADESPTPDYHPRTIEYKQSVGQKYDFMTFRDEGDFHASYKVKFNPYSFEIYATDWKTEKLKKKYGKRLFGLTPEKVKELIDGYLKPVMVDDFKRYLFAGGTV